MSDNILGESQTTDNATDTVVPEANNTVSDNNNETVVEDATTETTTTTEETKWYDNLSDDVKNIEGFDKMAEKFKDVDSLANSYINLEKMVGKKAQSSIPNEDSSPEEVAEFYNKLGRPESAGDYEWKNPLEGFEFDTERLTERNSQLHEAGITNDQYNKIMDIYAEEVMSMNNEWQQSEKQTIEESRTTLQEKWGNKYDDNIKAVANIADKFGVKDALIQTGTINQLPVIEMLYKVHEATTEDGVIKTPDTGYSKSEEIKVLQSQMKNLKRSSPEYKEAWDRYTRLIG